MKDNLVTEGRMYYRSGRIDGELSYFFSRTMDKGEIIGHVPADSSYIKYMSAALNIFLAGHKRYCYRHSTFMYHQMYCHREGTYQNLVEDRTEMDELNRMSEEYVLERTKFTRQDIDDIRNKKWIYIFMQMKQLNMVL